MGNCIMKKSRSRQLVEEEEEEIEEIRTVAATKTEKKNEAGKGGIKVKIVLTKEELELLLVKLKNNNNGGKSSLEDFLAAMEKARSRKHDSWRPSLESIMEDVEPEGGFDGMEWTEYDSMKLQSPVFSL